MDYQKELAASVRHFWKTRDAQSTRQKVIGKKDQGARSAVTGGAQMDGFSRLLVKIIKSAGISEESIFANKRLLDLPGFFRPTKEWDILVVQDGTLLAAIEMKSQVGPSFGNNFNNRTEEAIGNAVDLWTAYREKAFKQTTKPWLGYLFLLEDCPGSQNPVKVREPHFAVFPEFIDASYTRRYEIFCSKLLLERHYDAAALLTSNRTEGIKGGFTEPNLEINFESFANYLRAYLSGRAK